MTQKIVNMSEIEELLAETEEKYHNQWRDDLSSHSEGMADAVAHIGALLAPLLEKAPSVSGEAVGWQFFAYGKWHTGNDKNNHKQSTINAGYKIRELYTTPQPDRVAELEAKLKVASEALTKIIGHDMACSVIAKEALAKIKD